MDNIFGRDRHKVDVTAGAGLTISAHIIVKGGRIVDVNVLYHSLSGLASRKRLGVICPRSRVYRQGDCFPLSARTMMISPSLILSDRSVRRNGHSEPDSCRRISGSMFEVLRLAAIGGCMDAGTFKTLGETAGLAGLAVGLILLLSREIVRKNVFPALSKRDAYRLLRAIAVLSWSVAIVGIASWVWSTSIERRRQDVHVTTFRREVRASRVADETARKLRGSEKSPGPFP
jgi:hypothetical protein